MARFDEMAEEILRIADGKVGDGDDSIAARL
jgi:hypothetical protein